MIAAVLAQNRGQIEKRFHLCLKTNKFLAQWWYPTCLRSANVDMIRILIVDKSRPQGPGAEEEFHLVVGATDHS